MSELKPCPFCGGDAGTRFCGTDAHPRADAGCLGKCEIYFTVFSADSTPDDANAMDEAIAAWNQRTTEPTEDGPGEVVARASVMITDNNGYGAVMYAPRGVVWSKDEALAMGRRTITLLRHPPTEPSGGRIESFCFPSTVDETGGDYVVKRGEPHFGLAGPEHKCTLIIHGTQERDDG